MEEIMFGKCFSFALLVVFTAVLTIFSIRSFPQDFTPTCTTPMLPGKTVAIDNRCGIQGAGGKEAEQNQVKNNFCAMGAPVETTIDQLTTLQTKVEQNTSINFGDQGNHGAHGPTTDRAPLKALGEGDLVQLKAFVLAAKQEQAESVNCGHEFDSENQKNLFHDIHISLVATENLASPTDKVEEAANECQGVVAEMIPHHRPPEWTATNVNKVAAAHLLVRVTGQRFFDSSHVPCADGKPVRSNPKRVSLWEIHPIYKFEVCTANCDAEGTWLLLEEWVNNPSGSKVSPKPPDEAH
jgi:hypothetical protein